MSMTPEANPATPAAALYFGKVMHARLRPVRHRFSYRVMSLLIDLDRLNEANRQSRLFAVNRAALFSFHEVDHGERNGGSLSRYVRRVATEGGIESFQAVVFSCCATRDCSATPSIRFRFTFAIAPPAS